MPNNTLAELKFLASNVNDAYGAHQAAWKVVGASPTSGRHFHHDYNILPSNRGCLITVRAEARNFDKDHPLYNAPTIQTTYEKGTTLHFLLTSAAIIKEPRKPQRPCVTRHDHLGWILMHSARNGFCINSDSLEIDNEPALIAKPGRPKFSLNKARFEGCLTVTDTDLFAKSLTSGVGRHKGLGFGMLKIINN
ncbi:MAG: type I-E CRISPR-associated protein Cas6/Cse3/CasE [Methylococcales bacterium]|nr:type I-E CRISPR-associated protein Cas6/Cse3/CasE [Methylococcales bacterium]